MIEVVSLSGEPYARGLAQGRALAPRIRAHVAAWLGAMTEAAHEVGDGDGEAYVRSFLRDTDFTPSIAQHAPDLLDEVRGIARGAAVDPDLLFALQLLDEEWACRGRRRPAQPKLEKCSSLAIVHAGGPTFIGQNMDLGAYTDTHQVILQLEPIGACPGALILTIAGMIALLGVNTNGVAICVNSLPQLPNATTGIPVAFVIRRLLQARSLEEASDWVQAMPHATNQHYLLAEAGAIRSFEASAAGVCAYRSPDPARILHTNHPLADEKGAPETAQARENSQARLNSLMTRLGAGMSDLEAIKAALTSKDDPRNPVCRVYDPAAGLTGFTTGSMITELTAGSESVESWVSFGPPSRSGYTRLTLPTRA